MIAARSAHVRAAPVVAILVMLALALATMLLVYLETGAGGFAIGLLLALLPLPVYLALALWVDRYEKEPYVMLVLSFLWGASVAVFFAYVLNSLVGTVLVLLVGKTVAGIGGPVFSAPFLEESGKGAALFLLYFWKRDEFDNVTDGIVYAAIVGLGFATVENVLYYGKAFAEGVGGSMAAFVMRGILTPYSHPLFTAMTGIGLGFARERGGAFAWAAPAAGLVLAMFLHAAWNFSASLGVAFFFTYLFVMVPFFLGVLALVGRSLQRERGILRAHLEPYATAGELTAAEFDRIASPRARLRARLAAMRAEGLSGWRRVGTFHRAAVELAFDGWRRSRGLSRGPEADAVREREGLERLRAARAVRRRARAAPSGAPGDEREQGRPAV